MVPFTTDQHLKSYLDANQLSRERLGLAVLALDKRFSNVRPRHPHGGPDGGGDIDATFETNQQAAAGVGFVNGAGDTAQQKGEIRKKFKADALKAINLESKPSVFAFITNIRFTVTEQRNLRATAAKIGFTTVEIFDRERMRVILDSVDGFAARFQYLQIPLSPAEQASFFARWGEDIQSVIATRFQAVDRTLSRLLFLQEAQDVLGSLYVVYELDRVYSAEEIGAFRAYCNLLLVEEKHGISQIFFGTHGDPDLASGIANGQWECPLLSTRRRRAKSKKNSDSDERERWTRTGGGNGGDATETDRIYTRYYHDGGFLRFVPRLSVLDLHMATLLPLLSASLAQKLKVIHVIANGYKLFEVGGEGLIIDRDASRALQNSPLVVPKQQLQNDPWVIVRGNRSSAHTLDFYSYTPTRRYLVVREQASKRLSGSLFFGCGGI